MKKIVLLHLLVFMAGCSSWDKREVGTNAEGNYWIKSKSSECTNWEKSFDEDVKSVINLYEVSKIASLTCLKDGPNNLHKKNTLAADKLFEQYKKIKDAPDFEKYKFNNCFGSNSYQFFEKSISQALLEYYTSNFNCSIEVGEKFKKSKSPSEFESEVKKLFDQDFEKFKSLN